MGREIENWREERRREYRAAYIREGAGIYPPEGRNEDGAEDGDVKIKEEEAKECDVDMDDDEAEDGDEGNMEEKGDTEYKPEKGDDNSQSLSARGRNSIWQGRLRPTPARRGR